MPRVLLVLTIAVWMAAAGPAAAAPPPPAPPGHIAFAAGPNSPVTVGTRPKALAVGDLDATEFASVAGHVERCPACDAVLQNLDSHTDPLVLSLRHAADAGDDVPKQLLTAAHAALDPKPPTRVGKFELLDELGKGSFGTVYRALARRLNQLWPCKNVLMPAALINVVVLHEHRGRQHEVGGLGRLGHELLVHADEQILAREALLDAGLVRRDRHRIGVLDQHRRYRRPIEQRIRIAAQDGADL